MKLKTTLIFACAAIAAFAMVLSNDAFAKTRRATIDLTEPTDGPETPFPLALKVPFPWAQIEGIWTVQLSSGPTYFSFEVQTDELNHRLLRVIQLDPPGNIIVAHGTGLASKGSKLVRAAMVSRFDQPYMLFIGAYKNSKAARAPTITVLTMRSFSDLDQPDKTMVAKKVSDIPYTSFAR